MQSLRREPRQARQKVASYSEEPGCSHWTSKEPPASPRTSAPIVPLPDLSQVCFWPCLSWKCRTCSDLKWKTFCGDLKGLQDLYVHLHVLQVLEWINKEIVNFFLKKPMIPAMAYQQEQSLLELFFFLFEIWLPVRWELFECSPWWHAERNQRGLPESAETTNSTVSLHCAEISTEEFSKGEVTP